ncbi:MAG: hypothetical protein ACPL88_11000 [Bryobacteraceae bacterium]
MAGVAILTLAAVLLLVPAPVGLGFTYSVNKVEHSGFSGRLGENSGTANVAFAIGLMKLRADPHDDRKLASRPSKALVVILSTKRVE